MNDKPLSELGVGAREKYEAAFAAIHSGVILKDDETKLAEHARALVSYHFKHVGQDQLAAALLIHNLQFKCITERITARAERQTRVIIRLTRWLLALTFALFFLTVYLSYDAYARASTPEKKQHDAAVLHEAPP